MLRACIAAGVVCLLLLLLLLLLCPSRSACSSQWQEWSLQAVVQHRLTATRHARLPARGL